MSDLTNLVDEKKGRLAALDFIRIIAVLSVVMIHVSAEFVVSYSSGNIEFILGNIFDSASRIGVPLFTMVSGALILNENKHITIKSIFFKYIFNIVFLFITWSLVYAVVSGIIIPKYNGEMISVKKIMYMVIKGHYHMWYLYMIIGLYLITPILKTFVKKENSKIILYFIVLAIILQFTNPIINLLSGLNPNINYFSEFINKFHLNFVFGFTAYFLLGWYIVNIQISNLIKKIWCAIGFASLLITIVSAQLFPPKLDYIYSDFNILILIYSTAVFLLLKDSFKVNRKINNTIKKLSNLSFGVYIIHVLFIIAFNFFLPYKNMPLFYILIKWFTVTLLSFGSAFLMSKIPFIRKFIKM